MTAEEFFNLVVIMRRCQREYSLSKGTDRTALQNAKDAERRVDAEIKRVEYIRKERISPRLEI
ncbi:MAG: hypothetical protein NC248_12320 [Bacteroides sp.]|nr:hypothetical protein [Bacteroides sp.]MCM1391113.1 hypothetical protein [Bacteroides sp.]